MGESFWQKNRLVTHILFDLCLFEHFSPVANFEQQSIPCKTWLNMQMKVILSIIVINALMKFNTDLEGKMSYIFWTKSCENGHCVTD